MIHSRLSLSNISREGNDEEIQAHGVLSERSKDSDDIPKTDNEPTRMSYTANPELDEVIEKRDAKSLQNFLEKHEEDVKVSFFLVEVLT